MNGLKYSKKEGVKDAKMQEQKQYFESFMETMENELLDLIDVCKKRIDIPKFERKGLGFYRNN